MEGFCFHVDCFVKGVFLSQLCVALPFSEQHLLLMELASDKRQCYSFNENLKVNETQTEKERGRERDDPG